MASGYASDIPPDQGGKTIMFAPWPKPLDDDFKTHYGLFEEALELIENRQKLVVEIRNLRAQYKIPANKKLNLVYSEPNDIDAEEKRVIQVLTGAEGIEHRTSYEPAKGEAGVAPGVRREAVYAGSPIEPRR